MVWLLACTSGLPEVAEDPIPDTGRYDTGSGDTGSDDTGKPQGSADLERVQALLAGQATLDAVLQQVSDDGGWPVASETGWIFVFEGADPVSWAGEASSWELLPMTQAEGFSWVEVTIPQPAGSAYKFVIDGDYRPDPWARAYTYDSFGELSYVRGPGGHLERYRNQELGVVARTLRIWVPSGAPSHHLYAHDGQNLFDPSAFYGGWQLQSVVGANTLVVGIDNAGEQRLDEYGPYPDTLSGQSVGGGADALLADVVTSLVPQVEARYGVPTKRGMMGSSMGGLISLYAGLTQPAHWDFVASLSGTLGWGSLELNGATVLNEMSGQDVAVFLDSGGDGGAGCVDSDSDGVQDDATDSDNYCVTRQAADALAVSGWTWEHDLWHWHEAGAAHNEAAWAARVWRPVGIFEGME